MAKERKDVVNEDRWNVEALYYTPSDWKKEFDDVAGSEKSPKWPVFTKFKGNTKNNFKIYCY
jgi:oligoendopeptidase F